VLTVPVLLFVIVVNLLLLLLFAVGFTFATFRCVYVGYGHVPGFYYAIFALPLPVVGYVVIVARLPCVCVAILHVVVTHVDRWRLRLLARCWCCARTRLLLRLLRYVTFTFTHVTRCALFCRCLRCWTVTLFPLLLLLLSRLLLFVLVVATPRRTNTHVYVTVDWLFTFWCDLPRLNDGNLLLRCYYVIITLAVCYTLCRFVVCYVTFVVRCWILLLDCCCVLPLLVLRYVGIYVVVVWYWTLLLLLFSAPRLVTVVIVVVTCCDYVYYYCIMA